MEPFELDQINSILEKLGVSLEGETIAKLVLFWEFLLKNNDLTNLVSKRVQPFQGFVAHVIDSLTALKMDAPSEVKCLDLGSGGGFPGFPLHLARPDWDITLVESRIKKAEFLFQAKELFGGDKLSVLNAKLNRASPHFADHKEAYNLVTARAVDKIAAMAPIVARLLVKGGFFLAFKGPNYIGELDQSIPSLRKYNLTLRKKLSFTIPFLEAKRNLLLFSRD
jgi:16S rRNA (guanine527-N7)-methyltransferase